MTFLQRETRATGLPLGWIVGIALVIHVVTTLLAANPWHPDEHFQILEFAFARAGFAPLDLLPWEYHQQIRSTLQPVLAMVPLVLLRAVGIENPFLWVSLLRLSTLALACGVTLFIIARTSPTLSRAGRRTLWLSSLLLWFMPFLHFRFTGENLGGMALAASVPLLVVAGSRHDARRLTFAGVLIGLAVVLRFQMAFAAAGLLAWLAFGERTGWRPLARVIAGAAAVVVVGALVDRWFYGGWVFTPWAYFQANILQGAAQSFGTSPWHWYLTRLPLGMVPPLGLALFGLFVYSAVRHARSPWVWLSLAFLAGHTLVGHKEVRFLFPLLYAAPVLLALSADAVHPWTARALWRRILVGALVAQNVALLIVFATPLPHRGTDVDGHYLRFLWQRAEQSGGLPVYVIHDGPGPYQLWDLSMEVFRHPAVRAVGLEAGTSLSALVPPDTPPQRLLFMTTGERPPELPGAAGAELVYRAAPVYAPLTRVMSEADVAWLRALARLDGWADSEWARKVYEVRLAPPTDPPPPTGGTAP